MKKIPLLFLFVISVLSGSAQEGRLSGDLQLNANFYNKDSTIGASNTPLYDKFFSSVDSWLTLDYNISGFNARTRFDLFNNSALFDPQKAYTGAGLGFWSLSKEIKGLTVTGGYFYDQFGSGIVYRAYEDRGLGIDYATFGVRLNYKLNDNWYVKAFTGQEKNLFSTYKPIIKGVDIEGSVAINDNMRINPGAAIVNRTLDDASMNLIAATINTYPLEERFYPKYNVYAYSGYNTLIWKNITWYAEYAGKTSEAIVDNNGELVDKDGSVIYTTLSYSKKGFGVTGQYKRTENFIFRTSPNETLLLGILNYIPSLTKQNAMRLLTRYNAATQYLGEAAYEGDAVFTPVKGYKISLNYSNVQTLSNTQLWQEINGEIEITKNKKFQQAFGVQSILYNQEVYQNEPGVPVVNAITPFVEFTYKFDKKRSLRTELQYMNTRQDYGSWAYALLEFSIAPKFSFAASDMYNIEPNAAVVKDKKHYYNLFAAYTHEGKRFTISYVKQVEGYNCTGGVCRYEPAFSGVRFTLTTNF